MAGLSRCEKPAQRGLVEMIVVVMADQDAVDARQVLKADTGSRDAASDRSTVPGWRDSTR